METISVEIEPTTTEIDALGKSVLNRFVVFVAGGTRPVISFETFPRAERLAVFFAGLTNARMEVFDSAKEICYFIEPFEASRPLVH